MSNSSFSSKVGMINVFVYLLLFALASALCAPVAPAQTQQQSWSFSPPFEAGEEYRFKLKEMKIRGYGPTKGQAKGQGEGYTSTAVFKIIEANEKGWLASWQEQDIQVKVVKNPSLPSSMKENADQKLAEATTAKYRQRYVLQLDSLGYPLEIVNFEEISKAAEKQMKTMTDSLKQKADSELGAMQAQLMAVMSYGPLLKENTLYDMLSTRLALLSHLYGAPVAGSDTIQYEGFAKLGLIGKYDIPADYRLFVRRFDKENNELDVFVEMLVDREVVKDELRKYAEQNEEDNEFLSQLYGFAADANVRNEYLFDFRFDAERGLPLKAKQIFNTYISGTDDLMQTNTLSLELSE